MRIFSVLFHCKLSIFGFLTVSRAKRAVLKLECGTLVSPSGSENNYTNTVDAFMTLQKYREISTVLLFR